MNKLIKWGGIVLGVLVALIVGIVVLVPMFVDVQKYKPQIEALVSEQTGRSFAMGDDIKLSLFPWVGVGLSDLTLGNADGFGGGEMISVKGFEVRLKVMPLLSRQVQVDRFIMDSPRIQLVKNSAGNGNWEMGPAVKAKAAPKEKPPADKGEGGALPIASLMVERFSIINGRVSYADLKTGMKTQVSDFNLELTDISLDQPVTIDLSANLDGKPISLSGQVGPVGREPGKSDMGIDLSIKALDELALVLKGQILSPATQPKIDLSVNLAPFSPKKIFDGLGISVKTSDPKVLDKVFLKASVKGSPDAVSLTGGELGLDDSLVTFTARVKAFDKPDIQFDLAVDQIDIDRYLPPSAQAGQVQDGQAGKGTGAKPAQGKSSKPDYAPLRKMVLDGKATVGSLKAANLKMENILVKVTGRGGVFNLDPFTMDFYQGKAGATARVDLRQNTPVSRMTLTSQGVQAGPMIRDAVQKEIIEGALNADVNLTMSGDTPEQIKQTLGGQGELTFVDGAIVGIDIAGTIRNAKAGLGLGEKTAEKPKTDFAELKIPYTATGGQVNIPGASLVSPLLRLVTTGKTSLPQESLDFRIEPKLVATLKGQGDTEQRTGLLIPLLVSGTYAQPKIRPDLKAMVKKQLSTPEGVLGILGGKGEETASGEGGAEKKTTPKDAAKSLLKGFLQ